MKTWKQMKEEPSVKTTEAIDLILDAIERYGDGTFTLNEANNQLGLAINNAWHNIDKDETSLVELILNLSNKNL